MRFSYHQVAQSAFTGRTRPVPAVSPLWLRLTPGIRHMLLGTLFFSVMSVFAKLAGERLPTMELVLARVIVTLIMSWWVIKRIGIDPWGNNKKLLLLRGFAGFMGLSCYFYAIAHLPLADATVIQFCNPMLAALIAVFALKEQLRMVDVIAAVCSMAGVVLVAQPTFLFASGAPLDQVAVGVGIVGAIFSAIAYVVIRRLGSTEHHMVVVFYFPLVTGPASLPVLAFEGLVLPQGFEWLLLLGIGVAAQLGQIQITQGFKLETAGRASSVTYLQIVLAYTWGVLLFGEYPNAISILGALLILVGVFSVTRRAHS
ncbi:MAG: DMT family transporter [Deltaproteobacteria bacterium]|nr:DMT family transporter [Deltaproteobacteria bacterium]